MIGLREEALFAYSVAVGIRQNSWQYYDVGKVTDTSDIEEGKQKMVRLQDNHDQTLKIHFVWLIVHGFHAISLLL